VGCITPSTNPTTNAAAMTMNALKGGNSIIIAPHPRAKNCTNQVVALMNQVVKENDGPDFLIQSIAEPTLELTNKLMASVDVVVATGGFGMVKAAYSCGKPSLGVGQGNVQCIFVEDYDDFTYAAKTVINNRAYDYGLPCTGEQTLHLPRSKEAQIVEAFCQNGAFLVKDPAVNERIRKTVFNENGTPNVNCVGKDALTIAKMFGIEEVPPNTRVLLVKCENYSTEDSLSREIMCPLLRYIVYDRFEDTVALARSILLKEGAGHSSTLYTYDDEKILYAGEQLPVGRVLINQPTSAAAGNNTYNGLDPTPSIGCGTWGNNSTSENITYKQFINVTKVAYFNKDAKPLDPAVVFA